jgi:hypothetical protein
MGDFGNEYVSNLHLALPLAVAIIFLLIIFGYFYNRLMDSLKGKEHTSLYVVGGVIVTIGAAALISWKSSLLFTILFLLDGIFMIVGEFKRTEKQAKTPRRKRMGYAANGIIDDAKIAASEIHRLMGKELEVHEPGTLVKIQRELTTVLLKLEELKNIQEK